MLHLTHNVSARVQLEANAQILAEEKHQPMYKVRTFFSHTVFPR